MGWLLRVARPVGRAVLALLGIAALVLVWVLYKDHGPKDGWKLFGVPITPRTSDFALPRVGQVWHEYFVPEVNSILSSSPSRSVFAALVDAAANTLSWAAWGFLIGVVVGMLLALLMDALKLFEWALLPWVVLSQTVPLIALAPIVTKWEGTLPIIDVEWPRWMSVSVIAAYLAFFPVAIGMVRGLKSPTAVHSDYFRVAAAGWWTRLIRLKLPASVPFLIPALRLAAGGAVVGAIVAEISTGIAGGIGGTIKDYFQSATSNPARLWAAVFVAAALGLIAAGIVALVDLSLRRYSVKENS